MKKKVKSSKKTDHDYLVNIRDALNLLWQSVKAAQEAGLDVRASWASGDGQPQDPVLYRIVK